MKKSKLALPALSYSIFSFFSKLTGFLRDIFLASFLGASFMADIFFIALRLPNSFRRSFSEETFNPAYIPIHGKYADQEDKSLQYEFTKKILFSFLIPVILFIIVVEIFMPEILYFFMLSQENQIQQDMLISVSRIIFPYLLVIIISAIFLGNLNANKKFSLSAGISSILNIAIIISIAVHSFINVEKIFYLAWTVIIAGILQVLILLYSINTDFWKVFLRYDSRKTKIKEFFSLYWPTFISSSLFQANLIIGMLICSFETGAVAYLYYSERLFFFPLTLIGVAIGIVLIPNLSEYLRNNNRDSAIKHTKKASHYLFCSIFPVTSLLIVLSPEIISLLFERGRFTIESTKNTSLVFSFLLLGLPAATFVRILNPYFFAIEKPKIPLFASLKSNFLNLVLMLTLFKFIGFMGIPLALSISTWVLVLLLYIEHKKRNFFVIDLDIKKQMLKYFLFSIFLFILGQLIKNTDLLISTSNFIQIVFLSSLFFSFYMTFVFFFDRELMDQLILLGNKIFKKAIL